MDFAKRDDGVPPGGFAALALGVAAMALAVAALQDVQARAAQLEADLGRAAKRSARPGDAGAAGTAGHGEAVKHANAVAHELARRWDGVFLAIEAASDAEVALLAIEPDARKGIVRVTAEAKNKTAMLRYLTRLQSRQPLQRMLLEHHEVRLQEPERPVRFVVSGEWEDAP
jgi:hypothetical protein